MIKRIFALAAALSLALGLAACGSAPASSGGAQTDYAAVLQAARPEADNEDHVTFVFENGAYAAQGGYSAELSAEDVSSQGAMCLMLLGLEEEDVEKAAFSVSLMNVQSYGIAIAKPAEGREQAVAEAFETFIDSQKAAQQNYLPDQYAIASAARCESLPGGEVVLVMCEEQDAVYAAIRDALA